MFDSAVRSKVIVILTLVHVIEVKIISGLSNKLHDL